jgi:hypothetical protein
MKGHPFHNQFLFESLAAGFERLGATLHREYPVTRGRSPRSVDGFIEFGPHRLVLEVEQTADRAENDVFKARALGVQILLITVPNPRVARAVKRRLKRIRPSRSGPQVRIVVLTFGAVLQLLANRSRLTSFLLAEQTTRQQIPTATVVVGAASTVSPPAATTVPERQEKRSTRAASRPDATPDPSLNPPAHRR